LDLNTCRSLPETAGARPSRRGGTPAATPKVSRTFLLHIPTPSGASDGVENSRYILHISLLSQPAGQIVGFRLILVKPTILPIFHEIDAAISRLFNDVVGRPGAEI